MNLHEKDFEEEFNEDYCEQYNEDYFERGEELGISGYTKYQWMATRTLTTASDIIRKSKIEKTDTILDIGCAKGFMVKAFNWLGYDAYGVDVSPYALKNCDKEVKDKIFHIRELVIKDKIKFDVILCKDTCEHIPYEKIDDFLKTVEEITKKKAIFIIPLGNGEKYNIPRYEKDRTHIIRKPAGWWIKKIEDAGFKINYTTDDLKDIKPNWNVPQGNIFIEGIKYDKW